MPIRNRFASSERYSLPYVLLICILAILLVAGGASRADVIGQSVVRGASACALVAAIIFAGRSRIGSARAVFFLLLASIVLVLVQLIPLPPDLWQSLPNRNVFLEAVEGAQPWRPIAIVPSSAMNAAASLLVPLVLLLLLLSIDPVERRRLPAVVLVLIVISTLYGVLQLSGSGVRNPLVNTVDGSISGFFANRNHFALLLAVGCLIAPAWPSFSKSASPWRAPVALGLMILFLLAILATGSRAGMLLGAVAVIFGASLGSQEIRRRLRNAPRWVLPTFLTGAIILIMAFVSISLLAGRAESVRRFMTLETATDARTENLPIVLSMVQTYFPVGSGFGGFDPVFRMHEPIGQLKHTYFNHAHNDYLEILLDGGLPALLILLAALGWWMFASFRVWRHPPSSAIQLGRMGSAMLLLIIISSAVDYPARTPMIMAMIVFASVWLSDGLDAAKKATLPRMR